jgi:hypothetical protein
VTALTFSVLSTEQITRRCSQALTFAIVVFATPLFCQPSYGGPLLGNVRNSADVPNTLFFVSNETKREEPTTIILALMSGKCSTLKIAGRDFACRAVAFSQTDQGRANFTIALDDPADDSHIITFSGDNGRRTTDNSYELPIDRMLLNSMKRPRVDGLPVPFAETSVGTCKQIGNFAAAQVASISCTAIDKNGKSYELQYESDGSPITLRRIWQTRAGRPAISPFDK